MTHYHINVFWSDEDGCWIADVPDLETCSAHGETPAEAVSALETALSLWLESARANGFPVPEPRYNPKAA